MNHEVEKMDVPGLAAFLETAPATGEVGRLALVVAEALRLIDTGMSAIRLMQSEIAGHIAADMPLVRTIEKLSLSEGDTVLVTLDDSVSAHVRDMIVQQLRTALTRDAYVPNVVVKDRRVQLEVISGGRGDDTAG